jgi:DNA polymerase III subunit gamma/tau
VVRTLRNAVEQGKVHHAYLFVGSRGTGKTSMAKILAACLNCEHGPTVEPCGRCESCLSIASATSLDVIEMDAASNNSVDDIRELRESVAFAPVSGKRKVYILDEAHMLSTAAWNAFLKTLEEPPPGTVFVLATTEAGKVPATVVDRCHRFDFHRPTVEQIASVVRRAAEAESISIPPPAVAALARSATGSFRDALGTLEQLVTYSGAQIDVDDVLAVLGVADTGLLSETVDAVDAADARRALLALASCVEQGRDAASFAGDLEVRCRELLIVQTLGEVPEELSLTAEADASLGEQAARVEHGTVVRLLELLGEAMEAVRAGADPRTRLELALVKAARPALDNSLKALLARIERLESGANQPRARPPTPAAPGPAPSARPPAAPVSGSAPVRQYAEAPPQPAVAQQQAGPPSGSAQSGAQAAPPGEPSQQGDARVAPPGESSQGVGSAPTSDPSRSETRAAPPAEPSQRETQPAQSSGPTQAAPPEDLARSDSRAQLPGEPMQRDTQATSSSTTQVEPPSEPTQREAQAANAEPGAASSQAPPPPEPAPAASALPASEASAAPVATVQAPAAPDSEEEWLGSIRSLWPAVVDLVTGEHALLGAVIASARPVELDGDNLCLAFAPGSQLYKQKAEDPNSRQIVGEALRSVTGSSWRVYYELRDAPADEHEDAGEQSEERRLARFMEEFEAEEIPVEAEALTSNEKGT